MKRAVRPLIYLLVLAAVLVGLVRITRNPNRPFLPGGGTTWSTWTADVMHTGFQVTLPERDGADAAADSVFAIFRRVENEANEWKDPSPLAAVNHAAGGDPVVVPAELRRLLHRGIEIGDLTHGAFDITWAALWGLWDFRAEIPVVPDSAAIADRVARIDYRRVDIDDAAGTVRLEEPGMLIGLGGIAKGFALDLAAAELRRRGFPDFLIQGGGQVMAGGSKGGRPWRVGIRDPRGGADDSFAFLQLTDASLSTSGDYERFFVIDGVRYHHILDPRTGRPARGLRSATVLAAAATLADALSTAIMVLGPERGLALADSIPGVDAVLVDDAGKVLVSSGVGDRLVIQHPPLAE